MPKWDIWIQVGPFERFREIQSRAWNWFTIACREICDGIVQERVWFWEEGQFGCREIVQAQVGYANGWAFTDGNRFIIEEGMIVCQFYLYICKWINNVDLQYKLDIEF